MEIKIWGSLTASTSWGVLASHRLRSIVLVTAKYSGILKYGAVSLGAWFSKGQSQILLIENSCTEVHAGMHTHIHVYLTKSF